MKSTLMLVAILFGAVALMATGFALFGKGHQPAISRTPPVEINPGNETSSSPSLAATASSSAGPLNATSGTAPSYDLSAFELTVESEVLPLLVDPLGRRTGRSSPTSSIFQEIPDSGYFTDDIGETIKANAIDMSRPTPGTYRLTLTGAQTRPYSYSLSVKLLRLTGL